MSQKLDSVLLLGATGTIGLHILGAFKNSVHSFKRVAILTSQKTFEAKESLMSDLKQHGVEVIVGDITNDEFLKEIFAGMMHIRNSIRAPKQQYSTRTHTHFCLSTFRFRYHYIIAWSYSTPFTA